MSEATALTSGDGVRSSMIGTHVAHQPESARVYGEPV